MIHPDATRAQRYYLSCESRQLGPNDVPDTFAFPYLVVRSDPYTPAVTIDSILTQSVQQGQVVYTAMDRVKDVTLIANGYFAQSAGSTGAYAVSSDAVRVPFTQSYVVYYHRGATTFVSPRVGYICEP